MLYLNSGRYLGERKKSCFLGICTCFIVPTPSFTLTFSFSEVTLFCLERPNYWSVLKCSVGETLFLACEQRMKVVHRRVKTFGVLETKEPSILLCDAST